MIVALPALLLGVAAWFDVRTRQIPDALPLLLLACALANRALGWDALGWRATVVGAGVGFVLPALLFYADGMGGGDVKLLAALGAIVGWPSILQVLLGTAVAGGLLAVLALCFPTSAAGAAPGVDPDARPEEAEDTSGADGSPPSKRIELPYAVAILAGSCFAWLQGSWPTAARVAG